MGTRWRRIGKTLGQRLLPLNEERLCEQAQKRARLEDFGDPPVKPALRALVQSLETQADLHPIGRFLMDGHLRQLLENRLRLAEAWKQKREAIDNSPIRQPIFVVGMPRTGSTFLHELLAQDPANRAPLVWEVMFPVPEKRGGKDRRLRKTEASLWWFRRIAPEADSVYPVRACTPQECVAIHSHTFLSEEFVSTCDVPDYRSFLRSADLMPAYTCEKRFLQYLQASGSRKRWILKSPDHVYGLEELFKVFPDAVIVQTHRNPMEVLRSITQLKRVLHDLYAWPQNSDDITLCEARALADATERFIHFRDRHPELQDRFIDLKYSELVSEPRSAVEKIYERINCPLLSEARGRMEQLASSRSRYPRRKAHPVRELAFASVEAHRFKRYCTRFGLSYEADV